MKLHQCKNCGSTLCLDDKSDSKCPICDKETLNVSRFAHVVFTDIPRGLVITYSENPIRGGYCSIHKVIE
jgi:RNA polymerase subunit RPABC4/transcription elongation factor Spt4